MNTRFSNGVRVVWAITAKDIADAIRSKSILSTFLTVLFLMVFYRVMPALSSSSGPVNLAVHDEGGSILVDRLEESDDLLLKVVSSRQDLEHYLGLKSDPILGLVFPADLDRAVETDEQVEIDGIVDHWVSASIVAELRAFAEQRLTELAGTTVRVDVESGVYADQAGWHPFVTSLTLVVLLLVLGLSVAPNLLVEERRTKTMDALLVSPANSGQVVLGKALAGLFYGLVGAAVALAFNAVMVVHWGLMIAAVAGGALLTVALGLALGSRTGSQQQVRVWMFVLIQPLLLPAAVPPGLLAALLPAGVVQALSLIPTVSLAKLFRLACSAAAPAAEIWPALAIVAAGTALILGGAAWVVRRSDR